MWKFWWRYWVQMRKAHKRRNYSVVKDHPLSPRRREISLLTGSHKCPRGGCVKEITFVFFAFCHHSDCNSWLSSLINSFWSPRELFFPTGLSHHPGGPPIWPSCTTKGSLSPFHSSRNITLAGKISDAWGKGSHTAVMWEMAPRARSGGGESGMERREKQCGVCPGLVPTSHLRTLENPLVPSSMWLPFTLEAKLRKEREQGSPLCPSYVLHLMTPSKHSAKVCSIRHKWWRPFCCSNYNVQMTVYSSSV